jgi:hypothetical protein
MIGILTFIVCTLREWGSPFTAFPIQSPLAKFFCGAMEIKVIHIPIVIFLILLSESEKLLKSDGWKPGVYSQRIDLYPWHMSLR